MAPSSILLRGFIGALFVSALSALACSGGNKPPATSSSSGGTDSSDAATASTPASSDDAGSTPPVAASDSDAGSASGSKPLPPPTKQDDDECVPVAVDFEKRARPKLKECYREGKKKEPDLKGTVKIKVVVDMKGKIKSTTVVEKTLPDPVANCMLKAVKDTPFPEKEKCWDRSLTIPITFPTPP
jgi:hypothetical protein